jgi:hypothetical protein
LVEKILLVFDSGADTGRMIQKPIRGLLYLASPRHMFAARSENQTLGRLIFDAAHPCGAWRRDASRFA